MTILLRALIYVVTTLLAPWTKMIALTGKLRASSSVYPSAHKFAVSPSFRNLSNSRVSSDIIMSLPINRTESWKNKSYKEEKSGILC